MEIIDLPLAGLKLVRPKKFGDVRGFFVETWKESLADQLQPGMHFVQDNQSRSCRNTVRGLHFQKASDAGPGQAKLVRAASGVIYDVAVDIRPGSPTFGKFHAEQLDEYNCHQLFIPVGFAHGFCVISDFADVCYKVSSYYSPLTEFGFQWNDPAVAIPWPLSADEVLVSTRDASADTLATINASGHLGA